MDAIWQKLYDCANEKRNPHIISPFIEAGQVSAALLTDEGNIYTGVCIDTAGSLGMCAERNAIANMITNGESRVVKLLCIMPHEKLGLPCGACREFLMQLHPQSGAIEILTDKRTGQTVSLQELLPGWWGEERMNKQAAD